MSTEYDFPDYSGVRILLVEDNRVNQLVAKALLSKANFVVSVANDGQEAVDMVREQKYRLVLMDIQMPVMDGFQAVKIIRAFGGAYTELPIIAMTAQDQAEDRQKSLDGGMNEHLTKPISPEGLFQTIANFIEPQGRIVNDAISVNKNQLPTHLTQINLPAALHRFIDNWPVLKRTMLSFAKSHIDDEKKIKEALSTNDLSTATRLAHSIKGGGANIGAEKLSKVAAEVETLFKKNELEKAKTLLFELDKKLHLVCEELFSLEQKKDDLKTGMSTSETLSVTVSDDIMANMKKVKDNLMLDYGKCQSLVEEVTSNLQGSLWTETWSKVGDAVNRFEFETVKKLIDQLVNDIEEKS